MVIFAVMYLRFRATSQFQELNIITVRVYNIIIWAMGTQNMQNVHVHGYSVQYIGRLAERAQLHLCYIIINCARLLKFFNWFFLSPIHGDYNNLNV